MEVQYGPNVAVTQEMLVLIVIAGGMLSLLNLLPLMAFTLNLTEMLLFPALFMLIHRIMTNGMLQLFVLSLMIFCGMASLTYEYMNGSR